MIVWGRPISIDLEDVLNDLRIEAMDKIGIDYFQRVQPSGNDLFTICPRYDNHNGPERTPSCSISKESGILHCFGCGYSDSLPGLISRVLNLPNKIGGFRWLIRKYFMPAKGERPLILKNKKPRSLERFYLPEMILEEYEYDHPYMFKRGLTREVIDSFNIGFCRKTKAITLPVRDEKERIMFIKKRPIGAVKFHKYHIDEGFEKVDTLYGINIIKKNLAKVDRIFLSEGEFDVLSFYSIGKYAAGIQGDILFKEQLKQLIRVAKGVTICLAYDNDVPGVKGKRKAIQLLKDNFPLEEIVYPPSIKDPNELLIKGLLGRIEVKKVRPF